MHAGSERLLLRPPLETWESLSSGSAAVGDGASPIERWAAAVTQVLGAASGSTSSSNRQQSASSGLRRASSAAALVAGGTVSQQQQHVEAICASQPQWIQTLFAAHFCSSNGSSSAAFLGAGAAEASRRIDGLVSVFAQRHPRVYDEAQCIALDVLRLARWMQAEALRRQQHEQAQAADDDGDVKNEPQGGRQATSIEEGRSQRQRRRRIGFADEGGDARSAAPTEQEPQAGADDEHRDGDEEEEEEDEHHETAANEAPSDAPAVAVETNPAPVPAPVAPSAPVASVDRAVEAVAFIQNSLALLLVALRLEHGIDGVARGELLRATRSLHCIASVAAMEAAVILPAAFLRQHAVPAFVANPHDATGAAKLLTLRLCPALGAVFGPLLLGRQLSSSADSDSGGGGGGHALSTAMSADCWLEPYELARRLSAFRLASEITLGLMPRPAAAPRSIVVDHAAKASSIASLSAAITRRARHIRFGDGPAAAEPKLASTVSFRSRPRSPPPEEAAVAAVTTALTAHQVSMKSSSAAAAAGASESDAAVAAASSATLADGAPKGPEQKEQQHLAKRVLNLFADIPLLEDEEEPAPEVSVGAPAAAVDSAARRAHGDDEDDEAQRQEEELRRLVLLQLSSSQAQEGHDALASLPSRGVAMLQRLKAVLQSSGEFAKHLLPMHSYNICAWAVRRGLNLGSVAQVRSVGPKLLRDSGLLVSRATHHRFVEALQRLDKAAQRQASGQKGRRLASAAVPQIGLADVLSALDIQIGRGQIEAERRLRDQLLAQQEQQQQSSAGRNTSSGGGDGSSEVSFIVRTSAAIPELVVAAAQTAFDTPAHALSAVEQQLAQLELLAEYRRQRQAQGAGGDAVRISPASVVVALQDAVAKAQSAYLQQQQQLEQEEERAARRAAAAAAALLAAQHQKEASPHQQDEETARERRLRLEQRSVALRVARPSLPHYVTSADARGGVCVASRRVAASPPPPSHSPSNRDSAASTRPSTSAADSPPPPDIAVKLPAFPLPGQYVRDNVSLRRQQRALDEMRHREAQQHALRQRPPSVAFARLSPGLDDCSATKSQLHQQQQQSGPAAAVGATSQRQTVEFIALQRHLRHALDAVALQSAVPQLEEQAAGAALQAARDLQVGAATVTGVRALRALRESDIELRLAAPTGVRGELRPATSLRAPGLSEPSVRQFKNAVSVIDEKHREMRRALSSIRRSSDVEDDS